MEKGKVDRLSGLPQNVIDRILLSMDLKNAVQTSVLSTQWSNKWKSVSGLTFSRLDKVKCRESKYERGRERVRIGNFNRTLVDRVLLLRDGSSPLRSFCIYNYFNKICFEYIGRWVLYLCKYPIEVLVIDVCSNTGKDCADTWAMPSSAFHSWKTLTHLELSHCHLRPPYDFGSRCGFERLKSLEITDSIVARDALQKLVTGSPMLEKLVLKNLSGLDKEDLALDSLSLKIFLNEFVVQVALVNCPVLEECSFNIGYDTKPTLKPGSAHGNYLITLMAGAPALRKLQITGGSLEHLASESLPAELPDALDHLCYLSIAVNFGDTKQLKALYLLLSRAPNIEELQIKSLGMGNDKKAWEMALPCLGKFYMKGFRESQEEMDFVELILSSSPILEEVDIETRQMPTRRKFELMRQFKKSSLSSSAMISVCEKSSYRH